MPVKKFQDLTLADDFIFGEVMRQPDNIKPFLEALLGKEIARVVVIDKQKDLKDEYDAHGIRLDVYLEDENHTKYDVEVQNTLHRKLEMRARYYQSGIDRHTLEAGEDYEQMSNSYVIFLCTQDYFKAGLAVYERESHIKDAPNIPYDDGSHVFILNAGFTVGNANPEVLGFLRYIRAGYTGEAFDVTKSKYLMQIDQAVHDIKHNSGRELEYMTLAMKMRDERWAGRTEGQTQKLLEDLKALMMNLGLSAEKAMDALNVPSEDREKYKGLLDK
ncbi:Rpn family recombination-promoting nuclease/putative transposase [Acutalibacter sp. JLR.KK004]|uniref:Rpn family recombination-promoting nuclease/putative transposase n=1 Tax=Acutalibacter sp. JLR.KK004 TaxID=3112622 RepID=UPI002FF2D9C2